MKRLSIFILVFSLHCYADESMVQIVPTGGDIAESKTIAITNFDVDRFMGRWYEIARLPTYFEKHCLAPISIEYKRGDDEILINNSCATLSGDVTTSSGVAYLSESNLSGDGKLVASSMPSWLRWTRLGRGDYWIIYADYLYAMVASPDHQYLWVYSRQEIPPLENIQNLLIMAQQQGFDLQNIVFNYPSYYAK